MKNLDNKVEVIIDLQQKGYDRDFILNNENLKCIQDGELICPDDFEVTGTFLFADEMKSDMPQVIYSISSLHNGIKGILMTSFGIVSKGMSIHLWSKLATDL